MTAPVEPDILEDIRKSFETDLSWVTFAEENPSEPCEFVECDKEADWNVICLPCGDIYPFCDEHTKYTRHVLNEVISGYYNYIFCTKCKGHITDLDFKPISKG